MPPQGFLKLNIDGASKGNPGLSGGGAILRNSLGQLVLAGSYFYGICTNMEAEFRALQDGLCLLLGFGLEVYPIIIESDSKILVDMIQQNHIPSWKYWNLARLICSYLGRFNFKIQHTYREGNSVADSLANKGVIDRACSTYTSTDGLPM